MSTIPHPINVIMSSHVSIELGGEMKELPFLTSVSGPGTQTVTVWRLIKEVLEHGNISP